MALLSEMNEVTEESRSPEIRGLSCEGGGGAQVQLYSLFFSLL